MSRSEEGWMNLYEENAIEQNIVEEYTKAFDYYNLPSMGEVSQENRDFYLETSIEEGGNRENLAREHLASKNDNRQSEDFDESEVRDVDNRELINYIQDLEKGRMLPGLFSFKSSWDLLEQTAEIYEDAVDRDAEDYSEIMQDIVDIRDFEREIASEYESDENSDTEMDLMRIQRDIAEGGRVWTNAVRDTTDTFDQYIKEDLFGSMIGQIAEHDEDGSYGEEIVNKLEQYIDNHVEYNIEQHLTENVDGRITDIEQTIQTQNENIDTIIDEVGVLEGKITALDNLTEEVENFYGILDNHNNQLGIVTDSISDLEERLDNCDDHLDKLETGLYDHIDEEISELEEGINSNESDIEKLEGRVTANDTRIRSNRGDLTTTMSDVEELQSTVSALSGLEDRFDSLEGRVDLAEMDISDNGSRLDNYQNRLDGVEASVSDINDTLGTHEDRFEHLKENKNRRREKETKLAETDRKAIEEYKDQTQKLEEEMNKGLREIISDFF
ncbi:MAG: hypothetical protein BRC29_01085 [Nanohaloarchaea archaeon SW_7_43_1]|nr:MAG: hypothetical protein BRC29_01085 [Nanohaloarchaea archaeon SW_7_43_1]